MTRLAAVLLKAAHDSTPHSTPELQADVADACWGCVEDTQELVAAIPEPERSALEVGLLLAEAARMVAPWRVRLDTTANGATYVVVVRYGGDWEVSADGPVAALTALHERLGDAP